MGSRRGYNDLAYGDEYESNSSPRWDRDRFDRVRARSRGAPRKSSESFRFEERDRFGSSGESRELDISNRFDRLSTGGLRFEKRDRFFEDERYGPPARRSRPEVYEDRYEPERRLQRPGYARRQSSWDAHDRRPIPRYEERDRDDDEVKVSIKVNQGSPSPPRRREFEREPRERVYYRDPEPYYPDEDYRGSRIVMEKERSIHRRGPSEPEPRWEEPRREESRRDGRERRHGRRGKTRMPKRLVHRRAIIDLGYPFEEEVSNICKPLSKRPH